jgi:thiosulfate/3-mercaptopyruvate sulfurtransferase
MAVMTKLSPEESLVSTQWLADHLDAPDVRVVEATWFFPTTGKKGHEEYDAGHIPGAVFFDLDEIADDDHSLPHMLPSPAKFASKVRKLGLGNGNRIVVYDRASGSSAAARVWWTFRVFGHGEISILDGGMGKWQAEHRPVEDQPPVTRDRHFLPRVDQTLVRSKDQMLANLDSKREQVIDARSAGRFKGEEKEPWPHKKVGHIPGSLNLPWPELIDPETKTFLPVEFIREKFEKAGLSKDKPVVASCGSGVTACMLAFGLYLTGRDDVAIYDGSWAEWGLAEDTPVEK